MATKSEVVERVKVLVLEGYRGPSKEEFPTDPVWRKVRETGSELWLDSGDIDSIVKLWTSEFSAFTVNNTLLNKEIQKGLYDDLARKAARELKKVDRKITEQELIFELAFLLNAHHGLRLVERFAGHVSVELDTALVHDVEGIIHYARRFYEIEPHYFYVKVELSPEGLLATRRLEKEGVPVNMTLSFSARQNYLAALVANPTFLNVFLGRENQFVVDEKLGSGEGVGERATLASQKALRKLRDAGRIKTRQIAASMRSGAQVAALAGIDVLTIPVAAAAEFYRLSPESLTPKLEPNEIEPGIEAGALKRLHFEKLWDIEAMFRAHCEELLGGDLSALQDDAIARFCRDRGFADLFPAWTPAHLEKARAGGKIPKLADWQKELESGTVGLDALLNLCGHESFATDQEELNNRIRGLI